MDALHGAIQVAAAFCGTLGFGFLFNIRGRKLWLAAFGGLLGWLMFLLLEPLVSSEAGRYFIVSATITTYAEIVARIEKTPATTFCIVTLIPLVPGSALYYSMVHVITKDMAQFSGRAFYTVELAAALSLGIVLVSSIFRQISNFKKKRWEKLKGKL